MQENRSGLKLALLDLIDRRAWRRRVSMNTHTSSLTLDLADVGYFQTHAGILTVHGVKQRRH